MEVDSHEPILILTAIDSPRSNTAAIAAKLFVSSLLKSMYTGKIVVFKNTEVPLFKVERTRVEEVIVPFMIPPNMSRKEANLIFQNKVLQYISPADEQWVIFANSFSVALRNIDHLLPPTQVGPYSARTVDFCWTNASNGSKQKLASSGFWAIRGEYLQDVLDGWKFISAKQPQEEIPPTTDEKWTHFIAGLPLTKKVFATYEVVAPDTHSMNWLDLANSALVTVPNWDDADARKFLQGVYFGTYLGDETGLVLNILEP
jgi:hypothetical protein